MKKRLPALALAALLLSGCGAAPAKPDAPTPTPDAQQTAAPAATAAPTEAPRPAETPAPTEAPAPAPTETPRAAAEGVYALYRFETEGDAALASETGAEGWIVLRHSSADYLGPAADGAWREWRGIGVTADADGALRFDTPEDFVASEMTAQPTEDGMLEVSLSLAYPDGTTGGSTHWYRPVETHEGEFSGRALSQAELAAINRSFDGMNFCTCSYACPEEIDWSEVCYHGAGIDEAPDDAVWQAYLDEGGWGELAIEAIRDERLREYVWKHTLTSYDLAEEPLAYRWFTKDGWYIHEHGDTNAIPVDFFEGYADGDLYRLYYTRSDWEHYVFEDVTYVLTAYCRDGSWQYVSNLPASWPEPRTLLTLRYFETLEEAEALYDLADVAYPPDERNMEPSDWGYAVFTAQEDGVRYIIEMAEGYENMGFDVLIPGDYVASGVLRKGQSAAVRTNQPWYTEMRLSATWGAQYASYVFGQDNWKHLRYDDVRRLTGHDLAGEGRGSDPRTEEELSAFLRDGNWALLDTQTGALVAAADFYSYRYLCVFSLEQGFEAFLSFDRCDARPTEAPDVISMEYSAYDEYGWALPGYAQGDLLGDYQLWMTQLDGEQILILSQLSEGEGILSRLFPEADEGGVFTLHRWQGAAETEGQG